MSVSEILINYFHLSEIARKFDSCSTDIEDTVKELEKLGSHITDNYTGQANNIVTDIITKLREHLQLLQSCHTNAEKFVEYTRKKMNYWDETSGQ
jgi:uncharacterized protein YukE